MSARAGETRRVSGRKKASKSNPERLGKGRVSPDVTVVINGHREGSLIIPTLRSAALAQKEAMQQGIKCAVSVILDRPDSQTLGAVEEWQQADWQMHKVDVGDLGLARNEGTKRAQNSTFLAFLDGDDLFSPNWITQAFLCACVRKDRIVWHPSTNFIFGKDDTYAFNHRDMDDPRFRPEFILVQNYWTALSFAERRTYAEFPYHRNDISHGWGYEDWGWNALTISKGIRHKIVPGTAHFIRRKRNSLLADTNMRKNLPQLAPLRDLLMQGGSPSDSPGDMEL